MKNFKRTIAAIALAAAVTSSGSVPALAAEAAAPSQKSERPAIPVNAGTGKADLKLGEGRNVIGRKGAEMTEEEKAARIEKRKATLAEKLAAGEITQEKYDEMAADLEAGKFAPGKRDFNGKAKVPGEGKAGQPGNFKEKLAEKLAAGKITQEKYDEMVAKMESGNFKPAKKADASAKPNA